MYSRLQSFPRDLAQNHPAMRYAILLLLKQTATDYWLNDFLMSVMWIDPPSNSHGTPSILTLTVRQGSPCGGGRFLSVSSFCCISPVPASFLLILITHHLNRDSRPVCSLSRVQIIECIICISACERSRKVSLSKQLCTFGELLPQCCWWVTSWTCVKLLIEKGIRTHTWSGQEVRPGFLTSLCFKNWSVAQKTQTVNWLIDQSTEKNLF